MQNLEITKYTQRIADASGLNRMQEGVIPVLDDKGIWVPSGEVSCAYRYCYKGSAQAAIETLITGLFEQLAAMIEAGVD